MGAGRRVMERDWSTSSHFGALGGMVSFCEACGQDSCLIVQTMSRAGVYDVPRTIWVALWSDYRWFDFGRMENSWEFMK